MNWREEFPEMDCIDAGDPFLAVIVQADDIIDDHRYNRDWLGLDEPTAEAVADRVERERLNYELAALDRWWALDQAASGRSKNGSDI